MAEASIISMKVDGAELARVAAELKKADKRLRRDFGKAMREAADRGVKAQQDAVMGLSSSAKHTKKETARFAANELRGRKSVSVDTFFQAVEHAGLRRSIANSIKPIIRYQGSDVGVRIRARSSLMPEGMEALPKATNRGVWGHPIFGKGGSSAVIQRTNPAGWWRKTRDRIFQDVKRDIEEVVRRFAAEIK